MSRAVWWTEGCWKSAMRSACPQDCDLIHGSLDDAGLLGKREPAPSSSIVGKCEQKECQHGLVIVATGGEWEPPAGLR